jgi:menaquinone-specific isochorismate synthase
MDKNGTQSMALAGTAPLVTTENRLSLMEDQKEIHEHQLVLADIQNRLANFGSVETSPTQELILPTLKHLQTFLHIKEKPDHRRNIS